MSVCLCKWLKSTLPCVCWFGVHVLIAVQILHQQLVYILFRNYLLKEENLCSRLWRSRGLYENSNCNFEVENIDPPNMFEKIPYTLNLLLWNVARLLNFLSWFPFKFRQIPMTWDETRSKSALSFLHIEEERQNMHELTVKRKNKVCPDMRMI